MEENRLHKRGVDKPTPEELAKLDEKCRVLVPEFDEIRKKYSQAHIKVDITQKLLDTICVNREEITLVMGMLISYMGPRMLKSLMDQINMMKRVKEIIDEEKKNK